VLKRSIKAAYWAYRAVAEVVGADEHQEIDTTLVAWDNVPENVYCSFRWAHV